MTRRAHQALVGAALVVLGAMTACTSKSPCEGELGCVTYLKSGRQRRINVAVVTNSPQQSEPEYAYRVQLMEDRYCDGVPRPDETELFHPCFPTSLETGSYYSGWMTGAPANPEPTASPLIMPTEVDIWWLENICTEVESVDDPLGNYTQRRFEGTALVNRLDEPIEVLDEEPYFSDEWWYLYGVLTPEDGGQPVEVQSKLRYCEIVDD